MRSCGKHQFNIERTQQKHRHTLDQIDTLTPPVNMVSKTTTPTCIRKRVQGRGTARETKHARSSNIRTTRTVQTIEKLSYNCHATTTTHASKPATSNLHHTSTWCMERCTPVSWTFGSNMTIFMMSCTAVNANKEMIRVGFGTQLRPFFTTSSASLRSWSKNSHFNLPQCVVVPTVQRGSRCGPVPTQCMSRTTKPNCATVTDRF